MLNILLGLILIALIVWVAKKFYFPTQVAERPDQYPLAFSKKVSKREVTTALDQIQRWHKEGKITREEYDRLSDICLAEIKQLSQDDSPSIGG